MTACDGIGDAVAVQSKPTCKLDSDTSVPVTVSTFYKFAAIADCAALRDTLARMCCGRGIKGTILIAAEGINATISGADADVRAVLSWLRSEPRFADLVSKESYAPAQPFRRMKVKIKPEIVTLKAPEADPAKQVGTYVKPQDWNALISRDDVVVIDTRNAYEVAIGTFARAVNPRTQAFSEFPEFVRRTYDPARTPKVAMFCTGGIRCEKASALMLGLGFTEVYHLEGGILKYLETVPPEESLWRGECFVFDERVALEHGVRPGTHSLCPHCGAPVPTASDAAGLAPCCKIGAQCQTRGA